MRYGLRLLDVERPGRYEGLEAGAVVKDWDAAAARAGVARMAAGVGGHYGEV